MFKKFNRIKAIVKSELNVMLDKVEDPVKMLDQFIRKMELQIQDSESAIAKQIANERMLVRKYDDIQALVIKRRMDAEKALKADNEDIARRALKDKNNYQEHAVKLKESLYRAHTDSMQLKDKLHDMKKEYHEMKLKMDTLIARAESAQVRTKMNRSMSSFCSNESKSRFERMEEKVTRYETEADTNEDLSIH